MSILQRQLNPKEHRLDHEKFNDVYMAHFAEGEIVDFGLSNENPLTFDDTCKVRLTRGGLLEDVPIFYHCRDGYYDDDVSRARGKAINHAAWGFRVGQKVKVMLEGAKPLCILGHNEAPVYYPSDGDPRAPRPCLDIFRLQWHKTIGTEGDLREPILPTEDWWLNWFRYSSTWYSAHYQATTQLQVTAVDEPYVEPNGMLIELPHRMRHIMGMVEKQIGTVVYYIGDWLIVIGPAAYIFQVYAIGMPGPLTGTVRVTGCVWTPEREEVWLAEAAAKEVAYQGTGSPFEPMPIDLLPQMWTYSYVKDQRIFTKTFHDRFVLTHDEPEWRPKWIVSEFWGYDWEREATDPNTPNTIDG